MERQISSGWPPEPWRQVALKKDAFLSCLDEALATAHLSHNAPEPCSLSGRVALPRSRAVHVHTLASRPFTCLPGGPATGACARPRSRALRTSSLPGRAHTLAPGPCVRPRSQPRARSRSRAVCAPSLPGCTPFLRGPSSACAFASGLSLGVAPGPHTLYLGPCAPSPGRAAHPFSRAVRAPSLPGRAPSPLAVTP
jgi:hypothetical protein